MYLVYKRNSVAISFSGNAASLSLSFDPNLYLSIKNKLDQETISLINKVKKRYQDLQCTKFSRIYWIISYFQTSFLLTEKKSVGIHLH